MDGLYQEMISRLNKGATSLPLFPIHADGTTHANPSVALVRPESKGGVQYRIYIVQRAVERHPLAVGNGIGDVLKNRGRTRIVTSNDNLDISLKIT